MGMNAETFAELTYLQEHQVYRITGIW